MASELWGRAKKRASSVPTALDQGGRSAEYQGTCRCSGTGGISRICSTGTRADADGVGDGRNGGGESDQEDADETGAGSPSWGGRYIGVGEVRRSDLVIVSPSTRALASFSPIGASGGSAVFSAEPATEDDGGQAFENPPAASVVHLQSDAIGNAEDLRKK